MPVPTPHPACCRETPVDAFLSCSSATCVPAGNAAAQLQELSEPTPCNGAKRSCSKVCRTPSDGTSDPAVVSPSSPRCTASPSVSSMPVVNIADVCPSQKNCKGTNVISNVLLLHSVDDCCISLDEVSPVRVEETAVNGKSSRGSARLIQYALTALSATTVHTIAEVCAAVLVIWRFGETRRASFASISIARERRATLGIDVLFVILGLGTFSGSVPALVNHHQPSSTTAGLTISSVAIALMLTLWLVKRSLATQLKSPLMKREAACSLASAKLSAVVLVGSLVYTVWPQVWWVDSAATLVLGVFFVWEGVEMLRNAMSNDFKGVCGCT
ncbi:hypothetical protein BDK51DRAFT_47071 [Blyttiomyces helicus]|uniref:Cation efflux protein transmembrane domain-containing protein n=1 Tax=Blyttiomyces helicus TaxID=388810 RepID=A0A4P9W3Q2_9FUNG|nr:hypothetical protein BDK51DRAFT_47071 [Blyttiomyces helicus]|eukprot:RKO85925.1 hypothetical protein BDK51DRAFT_47071 [Blyttiomyces helicus]